MNSLQQRHEVRLRGTTARGDAKDHRRAIGFAAAEVGEPRLSCSQSRALQRQHHKRWESAQADFVCLLPRIYPPGTVAATGFEAVLHGDSERAAVPSLRLRVSA
jgi:hypothetical protein